MASTVGEEKAGSDEYQSGHMNLIFQQGLSFSGYERDQLFWNREGQKFADISGVSGLDSILDGRSPVLADFDNDGDLDVFLTTLQGRTHLLFRNNVGQENRFIRISLEGTQSGRDAFGAQVQVKTAQGLQTAVKSGGHGYLAGHDPRLIFGLGGESRAEWIEVRWPSGTVQRTGPVKAGVSLLLKESELLPLELDEKRFSLPDPVDPEEEVWQDLNVGKGEVLPVLALYSLPGSGQREQVTPARGTRYLLNFWATWCGPCRAEMPELQKRYPQLKANGVQLVGVSLDEDPKLAVDFARTLGVTYPIWQIDQESLGALFKGGRAAVPFSLLIDEQGRVQDAFFGWDSRSEARIQQLLE